MNAAADVSAAALTRPTEAQLRWAQFRFKRRAASIQQSLETFYQYPASVHDVDGAISEDGNSTTTTDSSGVEFGSNNSTLTVHHEGTGGRRCMKPKISRGRRALLRVSKSRFEQRRRDIAARGFRCGAEDVKASSSDDDDDGLALIFAEERYIKKKRRRQHRKGMDANDLDRARRFDDAFHAMLMTLAAAQPQQHEMEAPSKIWSRPEGMEGLYDTVDYQDMKLLGNYGDKDAAGSTKRYHTAFAMSPMDRGASWLLHLPKQSARKTLSVRQSLYASAASNQLEESADDDDGDRVSILSDLRSPVPGANSFKDIVDRLQHQLHIGLVDSDDFETPFKRVPLMKLSKYFQPRQQAMENDTDEKKEDARSAQQEESQSTPIHTPMRSVDHSTPGHNSSRFQRGMMSIDEENGRVVEDETGADLAGFITTNRQNGHETECCTHAQQELQNFATGYLERSKMALFQSPIASISPLAANSPQVSSDRCIAQGINSSPLHLATNEVNPARLPLNHHHCLPASNGSVTRFVEKINQEARHGQLVSADGKLRKPEFARLVMQYLAEVRKVSGRNKSPVTHCMVLQSTFKQESLETDCVVEQDADDIDLWTQSAGRVDELIRTVEEFFDEKPFVDDVGQLDVAGLESIVTRFFEEANSSLAEAVGAEGFSTSAFAGEQPGANAERDDAFPISREFVKNLVRHLELTSENFLLDGKIDKEVTERLILQFVEQSLPKYHLDFTSNMTSPIALANARRNARKTSTSDHFLFDGAERSRCSPDVVRDLVRKLNETAAKGSLTDSHGKLGSSFESLVTRYLDEALRASVASTMEANATLSGDCIVSSKPSPFIDNFIRLFVETIKAEHVTTLTGLVEQDTLRHAANSCFAYVADMPLYDPTSRTDDEIALPERNIPIGFVHRFCALFSSAAASIAAQCDEGALEVSRLEMAVSSCARKAMSEVCDTTAVLAQPETHKPTMANRQTLLSESTWKLAGHVSERFGGLASFLYTGKDRPSDHDAVAAFHRRTDERRSHDDISSVSSFRVLPVGIKNAVERFRSRYEAEHPSVDAEEMQTEVTSATSSRDQLSLNDSRMSNSDFTPQRVWELTSGMLGKDTDGSVIDTDGTEIDVGSYDQQIMANLLLSPTILTKRHQQAIMAVENREWEQVQYLIKANPWLAEMADLQTNQNLLHKLALYGSGDDINVGMRDVCRLPSPAELNGDLIRMCPTAAHKIDGCGNLPLHLAAASANLPMLQLLGEHFPGGASVRNEDGMLPLHLIILAVASIEPSENVAGAVALVSAVLGCFPGAVAVANNEGNLPIHVAASSLYGDIGGNVVHLLLGEARKQSDAGLRFANKHKGDDAPDDASVDSRLSASSDTVDDLHCSLVLNNRHETPLIAAIHARAGWHVIEALLCDHGGPFSVLCCDDRGNNALHLLVNELYMDPTSVLSIIKVCPNAVLALNDDGVQPIEIACINVLPSEAILAIVLADLPFEVDDKLCCTIREGYGASWYYLTCECDDQYVAVVEEVLFVCSYPQVRALCFYTEALLAQATPKCREAMQRSLRFLGRFEFIGNDGPDNSYNDGYQLFAAFDYGDDEGRRVIIKNYTDCKLFQQETRLLQDAKLDVTLVEEILMFEICDGGLSAEQLVQSQHCISIEQPDLTLAGVLQGMLRSKECQTDFEVRRRYADKIFSVLKVIAKGLRHLHASGIVHGDVSLEKCGKFKDCWKLTNMLGARQMHSVTDRSRIVDSAPPESVTVCNNVIVGIRNDLLAESSQDVWSFGKIAYEVLVGDPLFSFGDEGDREKKKAALNTLYQWDDECIDGVCQQLARVGVSEDGIDLISHCLAADPERRPPMEAVLQHPCWKVRRLKQP